MNQEEIGYISKLNELSIKSILRLSSTLREGWDQLMAEYNNYNGDDKERIELASTTRRLPAAEILVSELRQAAVPLDELYVKLAQLGFIAACRVLESEMDPEVVDGLRLQCGIVDED